MSENHSGKSEKIMPILVILLVGMAFLVGVLWQKVQNLEGGTKLTNTNTGATNAPAATPVPPGKLTADQAKKIPEVTSKDHIRGSKDAEIKLISYTDLECPFCKQFHPTIAQVMETYKDKLAVVYRHFPLTFHANAQKEAEASECIAELGGNDAFWKFVDTIFERTTSNGYGFALDKLGPLAAEIGVSQSKFQSCLDGNKYKDLVANQIKGGETAGVTGTPGSFVVNKKGDAWFIPGAYPFDSVKQTIDEALQ